MQHRSANVALLCRVVPPSMSSYNRDQNRPVDPPLLSGTWYSSSAAIIPPTGGSPANILHEVIIHTPPATRNRKCPYLLYMPYTACKNMGFQEIILLVVYIYLSAVLSVCCAVLCGRRGPGGGCSRRREARACHHLGQDRVSPSGRRAAKRLRWVLGITYVPVCNTLRQLAQQVDEL